jgi:hypothetical protein
VSPLLIVSVALGLASAALLALGLAALRGRRLMGGSVQLLLGLLLLACGGLGALTLIGMRGYRTLTREVVAATVTVERQGEQLYAATFTFPEGDRRSFTVAGDELYVDAHILKWHPTANLLGLHTGFELDRVAGRYRSIDDEQQAQRTVYQLRPERSVDLYALAERFPILAPLVDAQYGSGTYVPLDEGGRFEVRVSTSGLLIREAADR